MTTLDDFAPYPAHPDDATAEGLARALAVRAQADFARARTMDPADPGHSGTVTRMIKTVGIVRLLRALAQHAPGQADEIAAQLWAQWDTATGYGESLADWLTEYGIDPAAVNEVALLEAEQGEGHA